jgi:hypothetical protein
VREHGKGSQNADPDAQETHRHASARYAVMKTFWSGMFIVHEKPILSVLPIAAPPIRHAIASNEL